MMALSEVVRAGKVRYIGFSEWLEPAVLRAVQAPRPLAAKAGCTLGQFALAWVLRQPNVAAAIIGASRPEQIEENTAASGLKVAAELFQQAQPSLASAHGAAARRDP